VKSWWMLRGDRGGIQGRIDVLIIRLVGLFQMANIARYTYSKGLGMHFWRQYSNRSMRG